MISLDEVPKKIQYIILDSTTLDINNGEFTVDFSLESNLHMEDMSKIIGFKIVDFYITNIGRNDDGASDAPKYINIMCEDIPKKAQLLDEREGYVLERIPIDRNFTGTANDIVWHDKQWTSWSRKTNYFNPISIQKLKFKMSELQASLNYDTLSPMCEFYMVVEITSIDVKEKPKDREIQILQALTSLNDKIAMLNDNIVKSHKHKEEEDEIKKKKIPFAYLMAFVAFLFGIYLYFIQVKNKSS